MKIFISNIEKSFVLVLIFLFTSSNLACAISVANLRPALTTGKTLNKEPIRVAVIGVGKWGSDKIVTNLMGNDKVDLYVVLPRSDANKEIWSQFKINKDADPNKPKSTRSYADIIEIQDINKLLINPDIKAVFITTRDPESHFELAKKCLLAGKNVSIAKPIRGAHAKELLEIAKEKNLLVDIGLQLMYDPDVLYLKDCIEGNKHLGKITSVELDLLNTKSTVDKTMTAFDNLGVHLLSMLQVIMDVREVSDIKITSNPDDCFVRVNTNFNVYKDGSRIPVVLNTDNRYPGTSDCRQIKIIFEAGSIELDIITRQVVIEEKTGESITMVLGQGDDYIAKYGDKNAVGREINRFLDLIEKKDAFSHASSLVNTLWIWDFVDRVNELLVFSNKATVGIDPKTDI